MRAAPLLLLLFPLAACGTTPSALGITGPSGSPAIGAKPAPAAEAGTINPMQGNSRYAPNLLPTTNGGRYWGGP